MNLRRVNTCKTLALAVLLASFSLGCGDGEYSPDPARPGPPAPVADDLSVSDPNDSAVTALNLTTSLEYDAGTGNLRVFALVKDQVGSPLLGLNKHNFSLVLSPSAAPMTVSPDAVNLTTEAADERVVALVIDSSGSMESPVESGSAVTRMEAAKAAARLYVSLLEPGDRAAIVTFASDARTVQPLTADKDLLLRAIDTLSPTTATNFGAAMSQAVAAVGTRPGRRAAVLLTDGDDTVDTVTGGPSAWLGNADSTRNQGLEACVLNDLRLYTVGLGTDLSQTGLGDLTAIAAETGGSFFQVTSAAALTTAFGTTIPNEIGGLEPVETYVLTLPSPIAPVAGQTRTGNLGVSVSYQNANGLLTDYSSGTYQVP